MGKTLLLTPGFRFHPTDVELVKYYLKRKILGRKFHFDAIAEVDIYKHAPWDLPDKSCLKSRDLKWYFFCPREKKYACGARINRATEFGYWKTTGKDRPVTYNGEMVGMIKTLVFHRGRAPKGDRTDWVMHEYRLEDKDLNDIKDSYVLCMIFQKEGPGPRNGAQYGAPFKEEEWTDDEEEICVEVGPSAKTSEPDHLNRNSDHAASSSQIPRTSCLGSASESCVSGMVTPSLQMLQPVSSYDIGLNHSVASTSHGPKGTGLGLSPESCVSDVVAPSCQLPQQPVSNNDIEVETLPIPDTNDILSLLYDFVDGDPFVPNENDNNKVTNNIKQCDAVNGAPRSDGTDVFEGLDDLGNLGGLGENGLGVSNALGTARTLDEILSGDDGHFLELMDLDFPLDLSFDHVEDEIQYNHLSAALNRYPDSIKSGYQADMARSFQRVSGGGGSEERWFNACNATQVNAVDAVWSSSAPTGRAFGLENHPFNSSTSAPDNSHSLPTGIMYQYAQPDTM